MPRFQCAAQLHLNAACREVADLWKTEFMVRVEPSVLERQARLTQVVEHLVEILLTKMRQQPAVVNIGTPTHKITPIRVVPERGH